MTFAHITGGLAGLLLLGACGAPKPPDLAYDPLEKQNRAIHEVNTQVDSAVYGPVARAYGTYVPEVARHGVTNLRDNWRLPAHVVQYGLQGDGMKVAESTTRFAVNTLLGLGGLLDIAKDMGLPYRETGFDETMYLYGVPEGGYLELPLLGPGTERDWSAWALDQVSDPMYYVLPVAATNALLATGGLDIVNTRYELDPVIEELLHNSADGYTAQRISYLQNKRARLQGGTDVNQLEDIYDAQ